MLIMFRHLESMKEFMLPERAIQSIVLLDKDERKYRLFTHPEYVCALHDIIPDKYYSRVPMNRSIEIEVELVGVYGS